MKRQLKIEEAANELGVDQTLLVRFIEEHWILPVVKEQRAFDEEDLARSRLICALRNEFGVNDDAVPIILNLLDQMHYLQDQVREILKQDR